jgi:hypothetical protein
VAHMTCQTGRRQLTPGPSSLGAVLLPLVWGVLLVPVGVSRAEGTGDLPVAYTRLLVQEALLEDATRSLQASVIYAEGADIPASEAQDVLREADGALRQLRAAIGADEPVPDLAAIDFAGLGERTGLVSAYVRQATDRLRRAMADRTGIRETRTPFDPLPALKATRLPLTQYLVFAALAPTQRWSGWSDGAEAWEPLRMLDLQALSPWFGWYAPRSGTPGREQAPEQMRAMADRLGKLDLPMLVWLEPEYNVAQLWNELGEEMYLHDAEGLWRPDTRINNTINVFHPRVREAMCAWLEAVARGQRNDERMLGYELVEESALRFDVSDPNSADHQPHYGGYSKAAVAGFRARLAVKYGDIADLNRKWGTDYVGFKQIEPPPTLCRTEGAWSGPEVALLTEFQEFRAAEHAECFRQMVAALHRGNPKRPVIPQFTTPLFGDPLGAVDLFRMAEAGWDIITFHTDTAFPYVNSVARSVGKPIWNDEYIWSNRVPRETTGEEALRACASANLWRNLMWGARGLILFNLDFAWNHPKDGGDWNNDLLNRGLDYRVPRYAAGAFPQVLRKAATFFEELCDSEVVDEGLLIVEPTTSVYATVPTGTCQWWARRLTSELAASQYRPAFSPERYLADGRQSLSRYRTLVVPVGTYMPEAVTERLSRWVKAGGTLIALGPFATYDAYGRPRRPDAPLAGLKPGGSLAVGKGHAVSVPLRGTPDEIAAAVKQRVDEATGRRAAWSDAGLELMLRALPGGGRVLVVLNAELRNRVAGKVVVDGSYRSVVDVTVEGGMPVKATRAGGATELHVDLAPGEARVLLLRDGGEPPAP